MKLVKFYGGLGNQMFQYAFLVALREKWHEEVLMDTSLYKTYGLHNGFELDKVFNITAGKATKQQTKKISFYTTNYRLSRIYHYFFIPKNTEFREWTYGKFYPKALGFEGNKAFEGYWHHWEYFNIYRDIIFKEFSLKQPLDTKNTSLLHELQNSNKSVSIHVRRGDYLKKRIYKGLCGVEYYHDAIEKAKEIAGNDADFYFFTNDIHWCQENLTNLIDLEHIHFVDWNNKENSYKDMILMTGCRLNIIANSSFSWWGAYLNQRYDQVVIAPKDWVNKQMPNPIQMQDWILL